MGVTIRTTGGLIYEDSFDSALDAGWEVSPNDISRYSVVNGSLRLTGGADPIYAFFTSLTDIEQFVLDMQNDFSPATEGSFAGIVVHAGADDVIRLEEYFDVAQGTAKTYPWLRLVRDYNKYSAYWSDNGETWHYIGTHYFDRVRPKVGVYLESTTGEINIGHLRIFRKPSITVGNVSAGTRVQLFDGQGNLQETKVCRRDSDEVKFNCGLPTPFNGRFTITLPDGTEFASTSTHSMYPGDIYAFRPSVEMYYVDEDNVERFVGEDMETFLGYLNSGSTGSRRVKLIMKNNLTRGTIENIRIALSDYQNTGHYQTYTRIALDFTGTPGIFGGQVNIGNLGAGQQRAFWLEVTRPSYVTSYIYFGFGVTGNLNY